MANGKFNTALDIVTDKIQEAFPDVNVKSHPGRFSLAEMGKLVVGKRSVLVGIAEVPSLEVAGDGVHRAQILFAAFVICSDVHGIDRHEGALELVEQLLGLLPYKRWDHNEMFQAVEPSSITIENLYSGEIEKKGVACWGVAWRQNIR